MASELAQKISDNLVFPGQIKVTVIRELNVVINAHRAVNDFVPAVAVHTPAASNVTRMPMTRPEEVAEQVAGVIELYVTTLPEAPPVTVMLTLPKVTCSHDLCRH